MSLSRDQLVERQIALWRMRQQIRPNLRLVSSGDWPSWTEGAAVEPEPRSGVQLKPIPEEE